MSFASLSFLRRVLIADAFSCAAMGVLLLACSALLSGPFALPADLLREAGLILLPFAAAVGFLASRSTPPRWAVWLVIAANIVWIVDSGFLLFADWAQPTALGIAFVLAQAAVVMVVSVLEWIGLRRHGSLTTR